MFAVKGFVPGGTIITIRRGSFRSHRDARRYMLKRQDELKVRFGFELYVANDTEG